MAATKIVQNFDFTLDMPNEPVLPDGGKVTMCVKGPLNMVLFPRR